MDYREAADRIEEHMRIHHMQEYPYALRITEALGMAVELLRNANRDEKRAAIGEKRCAYTLYAVEVNNDKGFVRQISVFESYEDADEFTQINNEELGDKEYFNIIFIDYDENDNEIGFGTVC